MWVICETLEVKGAVTEVGEQIERGRRVCAKDYVTEPLQDDGEMQAYFQ